MKILFISHSYPPLKGGIEIQNYSLAEGLKKITYTTIIGNGRGKWWLPIFIPVTFIRAFFLMTKYDACLFGSGVLTPLGAILKFFHPKKKFFSVIHGLDIIYANKEGFLPKVYNTVNIPSIRKMDHLFMVGNATIEEAVKLDIDREQCTFIPNGVDISYLRKKRHRKELESLFGKRLDNKKVILRLARFVPHKGTSWFIDNIMPKLPENVVMIAAGNRVGKNTAGDEDDFPACEKAILANRLENRVRLLPSIPEEDKLVLLNTVDLTVSPNIRVTGSMEGFGINVIEAAACERVVVASNLEGLADAIKDGENGFLVESENIEAWVHKIEKIIGAGSDFVRIFGKKAGKYVEENYSWDHICRRYFDKMKRY